jgi:hypothetical protein
MTRRVGDLGCALAKTGAARRDLLGGGGDGAGVVKTPDEAPLERMLRFELKRLIDEFHRGVTPHIRRVLALGLLLDIGQHELSAMLRGPVLGAGKCAAVEAFRVSSGTVEAKDVEAAWATCHESIKAFRNLEKRVQQSITALETQAYLPVWYQIRDRHHQGDGAAYRAQSEKRKAKSEKGVGSGAEV